MAKDRQSALPRARQGGAVISSDSRATAQPRAARTTPRAETNDARLSGAAARSAVKAALSIVPMIITRIELWKIERLRPLERNPRTHSPEQITEIATSMREFGFLWPIMVNGETRQIVAGNGRFLAALELGLSLVPVVEEQHLSEIQRRAFIIADNKIALNAGWSNEILAEELPALGKLGFDLGITGFSDDEIAEIMASVAPPVVEEPPLPPLPEQPITKRGDLWVLGDHRVLCGDATQPAELARVMEGVPADAVWTDPPYNVAYESAAGTIQNDALSDEDFGRFLSAAFAATFAAMAPGAPIYVSHSDTGGFTFRRCFIEAGFKLSSCLIWCKNALVLSRGDHHYRHEPILYGWKPGAPHHWYGGRDKTTIMEFDAPPFQQVGDNEWQIVLGETTLIVRGQDLSIEPARGTLFYEDKPTANAEHPTMKPVALIQRMLANSAKRGAHVLDPFAGSGSTLIACEALGLRGHMVELDERYVDVIVARWQNLTGGEAKRIDAGAARTRKGKSSRASQLAVA
jgi:DNA modification methylase